MIHFKRSNADPADVGKKPDHEILKPGEYVRIPSSNPFSAIAWAFTCCPKCRHIWTLGKRNHKVLPNGSVTPSDVCPNPNGCTFHEFIVLDDWVEASAG